MRNRFHVRARELSATRRAGRSWVGARSVEPRCAAGLDGSGGSTEAQRRCGWFPAAHLGPPSEQRQISRKRTSFALRWMNERRCSTSSPIKIENISSAWAASSRVTCSRMRLFGSMVVSHS